MYDLRKPPTWWFSLCYNKLMTNPRITLLELENFVYQYLPERRAPGVMADLIGVFIDLKPVAVDQFEIDNLSAINHDDATPNHNNPIANRSNFISADYNKLNALLNSLGLKILLKDDALYTSKDSTKIQELCQAFEELHKNFDESGRVVNSDLWRKLSLQIGELLGYPKTAVKAFVNQGMKGQNFESKEKLITVGGPNRYYAHSIKHEKAEFMAYDLPLNQAIDKYAPKTAKIPGTIITTHRRKFHLTSPNLHPRRRTPSRAPRI